VSVARSLAVDATEVEIVKTFADARASTSCAEL
jgi:hypothetical protein